MQPAPTSPHTGIAKGVAAGAADAVVVAGAERDGVAPGAGAPHIVEVVRKRPRPGERRVQILQTLAAMLEAPGAERVTTAGLAARLGVSEAALYRHFASKAQMFEGLIDFIEQSLFGLIGRITSTDPAGAEAAVRQAAQVATVLLQFGEKNPGMARVMVGDALVFENDRLQLRMNQLFDRVETTLRQCLRLSVAASATPTVDAQLRAGVVCAFVVGRLQRFTRSGFRRLPTEQLDASLGILLDVRT